MAPPSPRAKSSAPSELRRPHRLCLAACLIFVLLYNLLASKRASDSFQMLIDLEFVLNDQPTIEMKDLVNQSDSFLKSSSSHRQTLARLVDIKSERPPLTNLHRPAFVQDPLCRQCYKLKVSKSLTCGIRIKGYMIKSNYTTREEKELKLVQVGRTIAKQYPDHCGPCDPDVCSNHSKRFYRLDDAGPDILAATTHYFESIPEVARIPIEALQKNITEYFTDKNHVYPKRRYLFEYNPSIVALPPSQIRKVGKDRPVYLASYRITDLAWCFSGEHQLQMIGGAWPRPPVRVLLGLTLLRSDLSIIQEGVYDIREDIDKKKFEDARLHQQDDQLYISFRNQICRIWIVPPSEPHSFTVLRSRYSSDLSLIVDTKCACVHGDENKNIVYFQDDDNRTIAEIFPMGLKEQVDLNQSCADAEQQPPTFFPPNPNRPIETFSTLENYHFREHDIYKRLITKEHGSFCCVDIKGEPTTRNNSSTGRLLLGVSHSKTKFRGTGEKQRENAGAGVPANSFFSRFYAMEAREPFRVVAQSGLFCLGFPTEKESLHNRYARINMQPLHLGTDMDCPRIHFISSMIEAVDDPDRLIIAYGVNDCAPRFVEISKKSVLKMLFPDTKVNEDPNTTERV